MPKTRNNKTLSGQKESHQQMSKFRTPVMPVPVSSPLLEGIQRQRTIPLIVHVSGEWFVAAGFLQIPHCSNPISFHSLLSGYPNTPLTKLPDPTTSTIYQSLIF